MYAPAIAGQRCHGILNAAISREGLMSFSYRCQSQFIVRETKSLSDIRVSEEAADEQRLDQ